MKSSAKAILSIFVPAILITVFLTIADSYPRSPKGTIELCLSCHDDKDLYTEKHGKKISLYVSLKQYKESVHSPAECGDCHENYNADELPHTKIKQEVKCAGCHKEAKNIETGVHSKVNCWACHSKHDVKPAKEFAKDQTKNCLSCHNNNNIQYYSESIHAKKNIGCDGCHGGGHTVRKISKKESVQLCGKCHGEHEK